MRITGGEFRGRVLQSPSGDAVRPTSDRMRQAMFNILMAGRFLADTDFTLDGAMVADVFCGTGALGLEALSRGAESCVFIDRDRASLACAKTNAEQLKLGTRVRFIQQDAARIGQRPAGTAPVTLVFADPPYRKGLLVPALAALVENDWLAPSAILVLESENAAPDDGLSDLPLRVLDSRPYGDSLVRFALYTG